MCPCDQLPTKRNSLSDKASQHAGKKHTRVTLTLKKLKAATNETHIYHRRSNRDVLARSCLASCDVSSGIHFLDRRWSVDGILPSGHSSRDATEPSERFRRRSSHWHLLDRYWARSDGHPQMARTVLISSWIPTLEIRHLHPRRHRRTVNLVIQWMSRSRTSPYIVIVVTR